MNFTIHYMCRHQPGKWYEEDAGADQGAAVKRAWLIHVDRGVPVRVEDQDGRIVYKMPGD